MEFFELRGTLETSLGAILDASRKEIQKGHGIGHEDFWSGTKPPGPPEWKARRGRKKT